jgi:hypothetical protein
VLDLRKVRAPIVMFASLGDNITPPQQAFNWVADVYASTEELKARGQVIIGLLHRSAGHLALFVSGKVAKREHTQIVSVLKSVEALPPGLYGMKIDEIRGPDGKTQYSVEFEEHRVEDIAARLNRFERLDEKPFEAVAAVSELNQRAYELLARPFVKAMANEASARAARNLHPLRVERWAYSEVNPALFWVEPAADAVRRERRAIDAEHPLRKVEKALSDVVSASLDYYRDWRDAAVELAFFSIYGNLYHLYFSSRQDARAPDAAADPRSLPVIQAALGAIDAGGYAAALARVAELLAPRGAPVPLARVERKAELLREHADLLPDLPVDDWKLMRGQQAVIVRYEPERALKTLGCLLADATDRERFLSVLDRIEHDREFCPDPTPEQRQVARQIREMLGEDLWGWNAAAN